MNDCSDKGGPDVEGERRRVHQRADTPAGVHLTTATRPWDMTEVGLFPRVILSAPISASALRLWLVLAIHADRQGQCFPSHRTILGYMPSGTSQTTIKRARGVLEEADLLRVERRQMYRGKPVQLTSTPVGRETTPLYTLRIPCGEYTDAPPGESVGVPPGECTDAPPITKQKENPQEQNADRIRQVFDVWVDATGKTANTKLDRNRKQKIAGALAMYPLQDVLDAVVGWKNDPFYCGQNDRGKQYNSLDLLLRDAEHIEKFRDLARTGPAGRAGAAPKAWDALRRISGEI